MPRKPTTSWLKYPQDGEDGHVQNHCCPVALEEDLVERIARTYNARPKAVERLAAQLWLDSGGIVFTDFPWHRVRLEGYSVRFKEEHAALYAGYIVERLADQARIRTYSGVPCVTLYQRFWHVVIPVSDAQRILAAMRKLGLDGHAKAVARRDELVAAGLIHVDNHKEGEA